MKKIILSLFVACMCVSIADAQLRFGVKAGANISGLSGTDAKTILNDVKNATGYQVGVLLQVPVGKILTVQPEVLFSAKGAELSNDGASSALKLTGLDIPTSLNVKTSYLEVPINIQAGLRLGRLARVYGEVSPYLSLLVGDEMKGNEEFYDAYKKTLNGIKDGAYPLSKWDYGVGIGVGAEVLFMQLAVKYDFGMGSAKEIKKEIDTVIGEIKSSDTNLFSNLKNRNLSISLAILF